MKIVTHSGSAHRDDFLACSVLLATDSDSWIERRDPTEDDMRNPAVYVVDVGGQYDGLLNNYDHHQFVRESDPCCALSLVLRHVGILDEFTKDIFRWFSVTELIDSKGPFVAAKQLGVDPDVITILASPVEGAMLYEFGKRPCVQSGDWLYAVMRSIGDGIIEQHHKIKERLCDLRNANRFWVQGVKGLNASHIPRDQQPALGLELYCKSIDAESEGERIAVTVTQDDRGDGLCLFRRNDDPRIDFSKIKEHSGVVFAHANGFVAKVAFDADVAWLISESIVK